MHLPTLSNTPLTSSQNPGLFSNISQSTNDLLIPIIKPINRIRDPDLITKLLHQLLCLSQIMARHTRVQVVYRLELEAAVEEIEPLGARNVHGGAEHALGE